jgi:hypothetical protein
MPFKSKAQRRKFAELLVKGEIDEETFEEWNRSTGKARLPERVRPKKRGKSKRGKASARSRKTGTGLTKAKSRKPSRPKTKAKSKSKRPKR